MKFKTDPFPHQAEELDASGLSAVRGILWQMGTGKTKLAIDTAAMLYEARAINGLAVIAPNMVHYAWCQDELPAHCGVPYHAVPYFSNKARTKKQQIALEELLGLNGLAVLTMTYEGMMTKNGDKVLRKFLAERRPLFVLDEAHRIKTPSAKRTKRLMALANHAEHKRILTGTPITNKPFDIYTQLRFLDANFWKRNGFASYASFQGYFGEWVQRVNHAQGRRFMEVTGFRNLEKLQEIVAQICSRVTKEDVLDLPPKVYKKRYVELSPEQKKHYTNLKKQYFTELENGELLTAALPIVRLLRFQQIVCGYLPGDGDMMRLGTNPRLTALMDTLADIEGQALIFARFDEDVDIITQELGTQCVRYDGQVSTQARIDAKNAFVGGSVRFLVGKPSVMGIGLNLVAAKTAIYYSNDFDLGHRDQSEDRIHRIGQDFPVQIIDLVARGTVDEHIVQSLREKKDVASIVTGDRLKQWI